MSACEIPSYFPSLFSLFKTPPSKWGINNHVGMRILRLLIWLHSQPTSYGFNHDLSGHFSCIDPTTVRFEPESRRENRNQIWPGLTRFWTEPEHGPGRSDSGLWFSKPGTTGFGFKLAVPDSERVFFGGGPSLLGSVCPGHGPGVRPRPRFGHEARREA